MNRHNRTSEQAFATAASGMVNADPVVDIMARLARDCAEVLDAEAVAVLVLDPHQNLSLLASTSSAATQLELLQSLDVTGPCVDVIETGVAQAGTGAHELTRRWGDVGRAIVAAGFTSVNSFPLVWHGRVLGGLNVFRGEQDRSSVPESVGQAFADVAAVALVHSADISADELTLRVERAMSARLLIENAKGVLSEIEARDMESAAVRLEQIAEEQRLNVPQAAQRVIDQAISGRTPDRPRN